MTTSLDTPERAWPIFRNQCEGWCSGCKLLVLAQRSKSEAHLSPLEDHLALCSACNSGSSEHRANFGMQRSKQRAPSIDADVLPLKAVMGPVRKVRIHGKRRQGIPSTLRAVGIEKGIIVLESFQETLRTMAMAGAGL